MGCIFVIFSLFFLKGKGMPYKSSATSVVKRLLLKTHPSYNGVESKPHYIRAQLSNQTSFKE